MAAVLERGDGPTQAEFHAAISARSDRWYAACLRITRSPELAEDAVQDALLNAWQKRHQFNQASKLETWIHRIAINSALMLMRKQRPGVFLPLEVEVEDFSVSPERQAADRDVETTLDHACRSLSEIERVCFMLRHFEEWRLKEIAAVLETNEGTVKQAVFRAVKKLRGKLSGFKDVHHA